MALTVKEKLDVFKHRFGLKNLRTTLREVFRGNFRPLRDTISPNHYKYKMDLDFALEGQGIRKADVGISRIIVIPTRKKLHYFIRLTRPGIFMGRKGVNLDAIKANIEGYLYKEVVFHLRSFDPYWDLYG